MRNIWFPKGCAEYMTKQRFVELGLSESAIGVRDRTFGTKLAASAKKQGETAPSAEASQKRKEILTLPVRNTWLFLFAVPKHHLVSSFVGGFKGSKEIERERETIENEPNIG